LCGIAGIVRTETSEQLAGSVRSMLEFMGERGPDNLGIATFQGVALGHTRLSIIDLDDRANQPFLVDGRLAVVFNGEIYNFLDLRRMLEAKGHNFRTQSDTEVIALGYLEWGESVFQRLDGMFSICLYDLVEQRMFLARDPFGKKPLYVHSCASEIVFGSDIRAVRSAMSNNTTMNLNSLDYYLSELTVPQPSSIWNEIEQIPAGCYRQFDHESLMSKDRRFWQLPCSTEIIDDEEHCLGLIEAELRSAVVKRTVADVPVGCFLSGGTDSGLVVALLASETSEPLRTYTASFRGYPMDEAAAAKKVAHRYGTIHTELDIDLTLEPVIGDICDYCGEPFADSSIVPSFISHAPGPIAPNKAEAIVCSRGLHPPGALPSIPVSCLVRNILKAKHRWRVQRPGTIRDHRV